MDAKVHRDNNEFEVKALFLQSDIWKSKDALAAFKTGLENFAKFHSCETIVMQKVAPTSMAKEIRECISM
jgi:uncharacterized protein YcaQ